jgi:hypothetical protein
MDEVSFPLPIVLAKHNPSLLIIVPDIAAFHIPSLDTEQLF